MQFSNPDFEELECLHLTYDHIDREVQCARHDMLVSFKTYMNSHANINMLTDPPTHLSMKIHTVIQLQVARCHGDALLYF